MSVYVSQKSISQNFDSNSWCILNPIEQSIKNKIESIGTPLKDWDVNINYGVKTGLNEAFIINGAKKDELIAKDPKSAEIIRPILRGRDIQRYSYNFADKWLIATFPSKHYNIDDYPAVKDYLLTFDKRILEQSGAKNIDGVQGKNARKKTNNKWFETQDSIAYWDDFSKQKIVWARLSRISKSDFSQFPRFAIAEEHFQVVDSLCFLVGEKLNNLIKLLNSEYAAYYFFKNVAILDNGGMQMRQQYVENILLPRFADLNNINNRNIDNFIYDLFEFTLEEKGYIKDFLKQKEVEIINTRVN